jgi:ABC-type antimicrobial peptide transport system permease subunit
MFGLFGLLALAVAAIGLFSVVSYLLAQRTKELGVRIALGAQSSQIARLMLGGALVRAAAGVAIGVLGAVAIAPVVEPYLFETTARDPLVFALVAITLLATTLVACAVPSFRACRVDPIIALRLD